jgi:hypothetical protein
MDERSLEPFGPIKNQMSFTLISALLSGMICLVAFRWAFFYGRLLTESIATGWLLNLTLWGWFSSGSPLKRLLIVLAGHATVCLGCRLVLDGYFPAWFENAIWYAPVASASAIAIKTCGYQMERAENSKRASSFSIRAIMILTAIIAAAFPVLGAYTRHRGNGHLPMEWLWDSLVLVVPVTVLCVGLFFTVLRNRLIDSIVLLVTAPIAGVLVCRLYQWNFYQTIVIHSMTLALTTLFFAMSKHRRGYRLNRSADGSSLGRLVGRSFLSR